MPHDPRFGPDPDLLHPLPEHPRVVFVRNLPLPEGVEVGAYTYYDDPAGPEAFLGQILYHYPFLGERLVIGRFCALATGTSFLMNGGNHRTTSASTYPFQIFGGGWVGRFAGEYDFPNRGDTVIGNDVWTGWQSTILPGVKIGDGAIVGAKAVVAADVPPYAVVVGNPARVVKMRHDPKTVARLLEIRWWDWDIAKITRNLEAISGGDIAGLERAV
jgi:virginiamycin A acetyltransferase